MPKTFLGTRGYFWALLTCLKLAKLPKKLLKCPKIFRQQSFSPPQFDALCYAYGSLHLVWTQGVNFSPQLNTLSLYTLSETKLPTSLHNNTLISLCILFEPKRPTSLLNYTLMSHLHLFLTLAVNFSPKSDTYVPYLDPSSQLLSRITFLNLLTSSLKPSCQLLYTLFVNKSVIFCPQIHPYSPLNLVWIQTVHFFLQLHTCIFPNMLFETKLSTSFHNYTLISIYTLFELKLSTSLHN